jgi:hypothetical protein
MAPGEWADTNKCQPSEGWLAVELGRMAEQIVQIGLLVRQIDLCVTERCAA